MCKNAHICGKDVVYCSIFVMEEAFLAFFETRTTELSRVSTKLSSSSKVDRSFGRSFGNSKNSPECMSLTY